MGLCAVACRPKDADDKGNSAHWSTVIAAYRAANVEYARFRPRKPHRRSEGVETAKPCTARFLCRALCCGVHLVALGGPCRAARLSGPDGVLSVFVDRGRFFVTTASHHLRRRPCEKAMVALSPAWAGGVRVGEVSLRGTGLAGAQAFGRASGWVRGWASGPVWEPCLQPEPKTAAWQAEGQAPRRACSHPAQWPPWRSTPTRPTHPIAE